MSWLEARDALDGSGSSASAATAVAVEGGGEWRGVDQSAPNVSAPSAATTVGALGAPKETAKGRADAAHANGNATANGSTAGGPKKTLSRRFTRVGPSAEDALLHDDDHLSLFEPGPDSSSSANGQQQQQQQRQSHSNRQTSKDGSTADRAPTGSSTAASLNGIPDSSGSTGSSISSSMSSSVSRSSTSAQSSTARNEEAQPEGNAQLAPAQMAVNLGAGALSGVISTLCIYPLDVIRRRMQLQVRNHCSDGRGDNRTGGVCVLRRCLSIAEVGCSEDSDAFFYFDYVFSFLKTVFPFSTEPSSPSSGAQQRCSGSPRDHPQRRP